MFFDEQDPESLQTAIERFNKTQFDPEICRKRAEEFNISIFKENIIKNLVI